MPKVSFRMASASREWVFGVQTNTARKIHRSDHTEGRLTTAPSECCVRKGTVTGNDHRACAHEQRLTKSHDRWGVSHEKARRKAEAGLSTRQGSAAGGHFSSRSTSNIDSCATCFGPSSALVLVSSPSTSGFFHADAVCDDQ